MRVDPEPWPWPDATREDKDRRVARSYRALCERMIQRFEDGTLNDPSTALAALDQQWVTLQANWVVPQLSMPDLDDQLTVAEVAYWTTRSEQAVRMWFSRARAGRDGVYPIETPQGLRVRWGDVLAYQQRIRLKRN